MNHSFFSKLIGIAGIVGAIGVMMGAFGAHSLKAKISPEYMEVLKTGVLYLFIHVVAMMGTGILGFRSPASGMLRFAGIIFLTGIALFSGSLFLISTKEVTGVGIGALGFLTPLGGLCFIAGWISLAIWGFRNRGGGQP